MSYEYTDDYENWYAGSPGSTGDVLTVAADTPDPLGAAFNPNSGYYDEITGQFIPTSGASFSTIDPSTSGNSATFAANWSYDPQKQVWTDGSGRTYDMSYLAKNPSLLQRISQGAKTVGGKVANFATSGRGIMSLLAALASYADRAKPSGGGTTARYAGPAQLSRTIAQGKYGPIARYAAQGGIMQAYRNGGKVQMEDGGFVLTERAVKGAGPKGIAALGAKMIHGPGTGTSDDVPGQINGPHGAVEARLSNGEAYLSPGDVERNGGVKQMYATMHKLERRA